MVFFRTGCVKRRSTDTVYCLFVGIACPRCLLGYVWAYSQAPLFWQMPRAAAFWLRTVLTRATSRLTVFKRAGIFQLASGLLENAG